jgi:3-hydroxy acid dehydrogenase / malonic semialdehyde reductase
MKDGVDPRSLTALVTGATSGFGRAIARRFAAEGARVIATGRRAERLAALKDELGERCVTAVSDVTEKGATARVLAGLPEEFRRVNLVVANAGLALGLSPAHEADPEDWETMLAVNCAGLMRTVREALPGMVERREGHVVLMGSVAGDFPYPGGNAYGATKAFVSQFALNLRADLLGTGVRVTSVEPGLAETEFSLVRFKGDAEKAAKPYRGLDPLTPEDVAESVFWACALPRRVNVNRLQVMPTTQAFGPFAFKPVV